MSASLTGMRSLAFLVLATLVVDCSVGQVVIRERVEVDGDSIGAVDSATAPNNAVSDLEGVYTATVSLNSAYTSCCMDATPHVSCYSGFEGAAFIISGTRPDGTPFSVSASVAALVQFEDQFTTDQDTPFGRNCRFGSNERGYNTYTYGPGTVSVGEVRGLISVSSNFGDASWDRVVAPMVGGGSQFIRARTFSEGDGFNYPFCGHGLIVSAEGNLSFRPGGELASLELTANPNALQLGEEARLYADGLDADGNSVGINGLVDLSLDQGGGTVGFLRWAGDGQEGLSITGVGPFELETGQVVVVAEELGPPTAARQTADSRLSEQHRVPQGAEPPANNMAGETTLTVTATLANDPTITGSATVTVSVETPTLELTFALNASPINPAAYLPTKDDIIEVTATLIGGPPDASGDVTFSLPQDYEFEFDGAGSTPQMVALVNGEAKVSLRSLTWWGVATVQADYDLSGQPLTVDLQIPVDNDQDMIADKWENDNGGSSLGGMPDDRLFNEETSAGNQNDGDLFTKWQEYQGVLIEGMHQRLTPQRKEVFVDIQSASEGAWAVAEARNQLDIELIEVEGINAGAEQVSGPRPLEWVGDLEFNRAQGYIHIADVGVHHPTPTSGTDRHENGEIVVNGVYSMDGSSAVAGQTQPTAATNTAKPFGEAEYQSFAEAAQKVRIYDGLIANLWRSGPPPQANSISESVTYQFLFAVAVPQSGQNTPDGVQGWTSAYSNADLNGNGGSATDLLNPFTLLSVTSANDSYDDVVGGLTEQEFLRFVTLHELAHTLRIASHNPRKPQESSCSNPHNFYQCHPTSGSSVMRSGFGPAKVSTFTPADIAQMKLRP